LVDARRIVTAVMEQFRPAVGSYVIQTFDDLPRQASEVVLKTPVAIVVGDSRISPVPGVYSNCRADSSTRTIRCDLRLLDDLIDDFQILYRENQREAVREQILQLVIAHELGRNLKIAMAAQSPPARTSDDPGHRSGSPAASA
jgi:hypothetical protein